MGKLRCCAEALLYAEATHSVRRRFVERSTGTFAVFEGFVPDHEPGPESLRDENARYFERVLVNG